MQFLSENYTWPDFNKNFDAIADSFKNDDAVILNDDINLNFPEHYIKRRQAVKILNEKGLAHYKTISLPQNFDITKANNPTYKQGRFCKRNIPFIYEYKIIYFSARIIRNKTMTEIPIKVTGNKVFWVKYDGERIPDFEYKFDFPDLQVDDIIEYSYKAEISGSYDSDQFYLNDYFPKLKSSLSIRVLAPAKIDRSDVILNHNIDSTHCIRTLVPDRNNTYLNFNYTYSNLKAIKYSQNVLAGRNLPHVTASIYSMDKHYFNESLQSVKYLYTTKYSWFVIPDSLIEKTKVYDKYGANMRKFISKFPENLKDSSHTLFFAQVIDSINTYKFVTAEQMHYGKDAQYALTSSEKLMRRELIEEFIGETYSDILFEKNIFYYRANVQDRRLGLHTTANRSHEDYELEFIALPVKNSFKFYLPRFNGVKYLPDELPFYYEGSFCALFPKNTKAALYKEGLQDLKFIKTPASTYNENVRAENAVFKINIDSALIRSTIKINLNGQFSTILRHFYNNEIIDSTIKPEYFKKCTDKPNSYDKQIKLLSQAKNFPFKSSYMCSENIRTSKAQLDLTNWFSFIFDKGNFKDPVTQNYFLDFTFTDTYNFLFEFNKPTEISNMDDFNKKLSNDFFEVSSIINKQENNKYLLTVSTKAKQYLLPEEKSEYLTEYLNLLSEINSLKLKYTN
ncbi:MAG: hypothetical protein V4677_03530 [Bacteroidota bacterium]